MNIDLVLKRLELIKEGKGIGTISDVEASIILKEIENLHKIIDGMIDNEEEYCLENNRLNNIIKRLEDFIEKEIELYTIELTKENERKLSIVAPIKGVYKEIYNVLQELKGSE